MSAIKAFLVGTLKIGSGIVLGVTGLIILGWGAYGVWQAHDAREKGSSRGAHGVARNADRGTGRRQAETLHHVAGWVALLSLLRSRLSASLEAARKGPAQGEYTPAQFTLTFLDKHGFKVSDQSIPLHQMTRFIDDKATTTSLSAKEGTYVAAERYSRGSVCNVMWNF